MMINDKLSNLKVIIVAHTYATGVSHSLRDFLKDKIHYTAFLSHPFLFSKTLNTSLILYKRGEVSYIYKTPLIKSPFGFLYYIKDIFFTFFLILRVRKKFDIYFGADSFNAILGIILKKIGIVKKVIFYPSDYIQTRFRNPSLNRVYHLIDTVCVSYCDYTWNTSSSMIKAREEDGIRYKNIASQLIVPFGTYFERIKRLPIDEINRYDIAFLGCLAKLQGLELIVNALGTIIRQIPSVRLLILGDGPYRVELEGQVRTLGLEKHVVFFGYINDHKEVERILTYCAIGLAPYVPSDETLAKNTDPGKPKTYAACGLPVIITRVPKVASEIEQEGAGIVINYDKDELAQAVVKLLTNRQLYSEFRENAIRFASRYSWDKILEKAISQSLS